MQKRLKKLKLLFSETDSYDYHSLLLYRNDQFGHPATNNPFYILWLKESQMGFKRHDK